MGRAWRFGRHPASSSLQYTGMGYTVNVVDVRCAAPGFAGRSRWVVALVFAVWLVVGAAGLHCGVPRFDSTSHRVSTSLGTELAINADHTGLSDGSRSSCPAKFATAVIPSAAGTLVALGTAVAVVAVIGDCTRLVTTAQRGPPARLISVAITGQGLLTRLCRALR